MRKQEFVRCNWITDEMGRIGAFSPSKTVWKRIHSMVFRAKRDIKR